MNYLSHHYVARRVHPEQEAPPLFFLGNLLPDLLSQEGGGRLRSAGDATGPLADGIRLHLASDARFHAAPEFKAAQAEVTALLIAAPFTVPVHRRFFVAHILVEIALDALLLEDDPALPEDLYTCLADALVGDLRAEVEAITGYPVPHLLSMVERFVKYRFLGDYAAPKGRARAVARICQRVGIENFTTAADLETLADLCVQFEAPLKLYQDRLLIVPQGFKIRKTA